MPEDGEDTAMDLNLRRLRYFVVTAEQLHFGKAAERLHIAQPVLSRQIATLERELGVTLLQRSSQGTELTNAGVEVLDAARRLLEGAIRLERRARLAGRGQTHFTIGFMPGISVTALSRRLGERFPDIEVDVVRTGWLDQVEVVRDGRVDASLVRQPADTTGMAVVPMFSEPRLVALPEGHHLADGAAPSLADLALIDLLQPPDSHPDWRDAAAAARPDALTTARQRLPVVDTVEEKLEQVAEGRGIVLLPESAATFYNRPDVVYRYVEGLAAVHTVLVFDPTRASPLLRALREIVVELYPPRPA